MNLPPDRAASKPEDRQRPRGRVAALALRVRVLARAIEDNDEEQIERAILRVSQSRRLLAPLALGVSAFVLLFQSLKLLVANWRLTLVQVLPAMWIWLAMFDLKAHVLHGKSLHVLQGPLLIPIGLTVVAITVVSFFLNAVFAFAVAEPGRPDLLAALRQARAHVRPIVISGSVVGALLAFATTIVTRWGEPWFALALGIVVGVMMVCYVAVPARLIGVTPAQPRRDRLTTTAVAGLLGATVSAPPYLLGRLGILMLGAKALLIPGIVILAVAVTLQAGATGAVRAIKLTVKLTATGASGNRPSRRSRQATHGPAH